MNDIGEYDDYSLGRMKFHFFQKKKKKIVRKRLVVVTIEVDKKFNDFNGINIL